MAKKFFYVCAGLLCLGLAYHFGAHSAVAQGEGGVSVADLVTGACPPEIVFASHRVVYFSSAAIPSPAEQIAEAVPGATPIILLKFGGCRDQHGDFYLVAVLENGDVYSHPFNSGSWTFHGNLLGGATAVQHQSWGSVKARYR